MKLAIFYQHMLDAARQMGYSKEESPIEAARLASKLGYEMVECSYDHIKEDPVGFKEYLQSFGLAVSCVYISFELNHVIDIDDIQNKLQNAAKAGTGKVLIIPGYYDHAESETDEYNKETEAFIQGLALICDEAGKLNIQVVVEDFDNDRSPCCRTDQLVMLTERISNLWVAFDTGNFLYYLDDAISSYPKLKNRIAHVHLKDRLTSPAHQEDKQVRRTDGSMVYPCAACEGIARIRQILQWLKQDGYDGILSVEHFGSICEAELAKRSIQNVKAVWESALED